LQPVSTISLVARCILNIHARALHHLFATPADSASASYSKPSSTWRQKRSAVHIIYAG